MEPLSAKRILVVRAGALGDTLMATPVLRALHNRNPQANIDFVCSAQAAPLLELNPNVTQIYRLRRRNLPYWLSVEKLRLTRLIRREGYDRVILLETAPRYRELLRHSDVLHIRSFTDVPFDPRQHCISNYLRVAGISDPGVGDFEMDLPIDDSDDLVSERLLSGLPPPHIGVHVGYGPRRSKPNQSLRLRGWGADNFVQLVGRLLDGGASIILTGSKEDQVDTHAISSHFESARVRSIAGRTRIRELAAVIKRLDLLISVDSAPAHMAAALKIPVLVLWGPGILEQTRPMSALSPIRIIQSGVPCAPCFGTPAMKTCTDNICMKRITPDLVLQAVEDMLHPPWT